MILNPLLIFVRSGFFGGLILEGLIIEGNFEFRSAGLDKKNRKVLQPKTSNRNTSWAYIREVSLLESFLLMRFGGLIFRVALFSEGLVIRILRYS